MKKIVIVGGVIAAVAIAVVVIILSVTHNGGDSDPEPEEREKLFRSILNIKSVDEYKELTSSIKNKHYESNDGLGATIYDVEFLCKKKVPFTLFFDENKNISRIDTFLYINYDEENETVEQISGDALKQVVADAMLEYCMLFEVDYVPRLYIEYDDGSFEELEFSEQYEKIISGDGEMSFAVRDKEGSYWVMILSATDEICDISISIDFDVEKYIDYYANISLYDSEE